MRRSSNTIRLRRDRKIFSIPANSLSDAREFHARNRNVASDHLRMHQETDAIFQKIASNGRRRKAPPQAGQTQERAGTTSRGDRPCDVASTSGAAGTSSARSPRTSRRMPYPSQPRQSKTSTSIGALWSCSTSLIRRERRTATHGDEINNGPRYGNTETRCLIPP